MESAAPDFSISAASSRFSAEINSISGKDSVANFMVGLFNSGKMIFIG